MTNFTDAVSVAGTRLTDDGFLLANARTARTGVQTYRGAEVGRPDLNMVKVWRAEDQVFGKDSLDTFALLPVTMDHPSEAVTAINAKGLAVGTTGSEVLRDGEWLKIGLKITDAAAVQAVLDGRRGLSVGYTTELVWDAGITPDGQAYDARQTNIRANHVAICAAGRAGPQARIGDSDDGGKDRASWGAAPINDTKEGATMADAIKTRTVIVDGLSVETTDAGAQALEKLTKAIETADAALADEKTAHAKTLSYKDEEIGKLKAELKTAKDALPKPGDLDRMVADRAALVATVQKITSDVKPEGLSDADLRKAAVTAKLGDDAVKDASDAEITGMFKALSAGMGHAKPDPVRGAMKDSLRMVANDGWNDGVFAAAGVNLMKGV